MLGGLGARFQVATHCRQRNDAADATNLDTHGGELT
jgi:hypothetical protein